MERLQDYDYAEVRKTKVILFNFIMTTIERLEKYLRKNMGQYPPEIRYFNGLDEGSATERPFCTLNGDFKGKTLNESFDLFLKSKGF